MVKMRYTLAFDENRNLFTLTTFDALSLRDIQDMIRAMLMHESWRKGRDLLLDHRLASFSEISPADMKMLADTVAVLDQKLGPRYCAIITPDDGISKHAMYQYEVDPRADLVTRIFLAHEYENALHWLAECAASSN